MKNYTSHFLIATIITVALGFSGIEFTGAVVVRFLALIAGIGLMLSCLDAVIISKRMHKIQVKKEKQLREKRNIE